MQSHAAVVSDTVSLPSNLQGNDLVPELEFLLGLQIIHQ